MRSILIVLALLVPARVFAHAPSDAHLYLERGGDDRFVGRLDVAVRDLDAALAIDDGDGELTWRELDAARARIAAYVAARVVLVHCAVRQGAPSLVDLSDGAYWSTPLVARCEPGTLRVAYSLLFDVDAQHRGLLHVAGNTTIVRGSGTVSVEVGAAASFASFVREGVWHIWIGIDHVVFLVCLLLPAVFPARQRALRDVTVEVLEIVTAFTLAHSITLVISAVGLVSLPSRLVETAIALSVVAAAANNLLRIVDARWAVAFALGLLHGFGFSSVLGDLGLPSHQLVAALLGFNLGVELGQAAIVVVLLPALYAIRTTVAYRALLYGGSGFAALVGSLWAYERLVT